MAYSISDIRNTIGQNGLLSTNKFLVYFASPSIMENISINSLDSKHSAAAGSSESLIQLRAESAKIPGISLMTGDVNRYGLGPMQKMAFNTAFTETSLTFVADKKAEIYNYFYTWLNGIFDFAGVSNGSNEVANRDPSYQAQYKKYYVTDLNVYVFDNYGNRVQTVIMRDAFPISLNEVTLNWASSNEVMRLVVNLSFKDWVMDKVSASAPDIQPTALDKITTYPVSVKSTADQTPTNPNPIGQNEINPETGNFIGPTGETQTPTAHTGA